MDIINFTATWSLVSTICRYKLHNLLFDCISLLCRCGLYCYRRSSVVCLSVTIFSPTKTAEPIEIPFGVWTWVGPGNHVSDGGPDPQCEWAILRGNVICTAKGWLKEQDQQLFYNGIRALEERRTNYALGRTKCISVAGNYVEKRQNMRYISCD